MKKDFLWYALAAGLFASCGSSDEEELTPQPTPEPEQETTTVVKIETRATDVTFENGDAIGLFMVYGEALQNTDNYLNNVKYTHNSGVWTADSEFFWKNMVASADFYAYYPATDYIEDATAYNFTVQADQSDEANYSSSDFLWGASKEQTPTESAIYLELNHMMSKVLINIAAGQGFTESELSDSGVNITVHNVKTQTQINLGTGAITLTGDAGDVTPLKKSALSAQLLLPPQTIAGDIIEVTYGENVYKLNKSFTCESGKQYTCTVTLTKTQGGINVGIGAWDVVDGDFGGVVN